MKGLGMLEKKVWLEGKSLEVNKIIALKNEKYAAVSLFLQRFCSDDAYFEVQTSGSTGTPKKIRLAKKHMFASAQKTIETLRLKLKTKALLAISPEHIGGIMMLVRWLEGNWDLYLAEPKANPLAGLDTSIDFTALVPYQLQASLTDLHKVKQAIIGGGAVSQQLEEEATKTGCKLYHTYGMTETISHVALRAFGVEEYFTAVSEVRFLQDARKCLQIHAPHLGIMGLQTNDIVELQDDTHFKWLGRYDNVVNSGGIKLHPESLEKKLEHLEYSFFLVGVPDKALGEKLVMVVEDANPTEEKRNGIIQNLKDSLGKYEIPKEIFAVNQLIKTPTGKLKRDLNLYDLSDF